jgi:hypothetical protein
MTDAAFAESADPFAEDAEAEAARSSSLSERVLNQDEIDSLLGFDLGEGDDAERTGIRAIINSALVSYERLPMLEIVFDRLVRLMTTSLRNFTSDNVEVSLDNISSIRFGDYLNSIPLPAILAVFRAEELDNYGLLTVDSNLIYSIVDVLLGGRRGTARDVLTLLDESGVLVACADDSLAGLLREFQWKALFCERRADVLSGMRFVVFGHALQEQALHPHPGITGKCLFIATDHEGLLQALPELLARLDAGTAALIDAPDLLGSTRSLAPLPLLGIPGWDAASESDRYYDNRAVFRPGRR